jgi:hypothetical protein
MQTDVCDRTPHRHSQPARTVILITVTMIIATITAGWSWDVMITATIITCVWGGSCAWKQICVAGHNDTLKDSTVYKDTIRTGGLHSLRSREETVWCCGIIMKYGPQHPTARTRPNERSAVSGPAHTGGMLTSVRIRTARRLPPPHPPGVRIAPRCLPGCLSLSLSFLSVRS